MKKFKINWLIYFKELYFILLKYPSILIKVITYLVFIELARDKVPLYIKIIFFIFVWITLEIDFRYRKLDQDLIKKSTIIYDKNINSLLEKPKGQWDK